MDQLTVSIAAAFAGLAALICLVWWMVRRLKIERASQPATERSALWVLIAAGLAAYLMAYFAFGGHLLAPIRLAMVGLAIASFEFVRRLMR